MRICAGCPYAAVPRALTSDSFFKSTSHEDILLSCFTFLDLVCLLQTASYQNGQKHVGVGGPGAAGASGKGPAGLCLQPR